MTSAPTSLRRGAGTVALLSALLLALTSLLLAPPASAQEPLPEGPYPALVSGNPFCSTYGLTEVTRFDPVPGETGDVIEQDGVTITVTDHKDNDEILAFTWTSTSWISAVIVKAGNEANIYAYDPAVTSGSAITVDNLGVSHISFCLGEEPGDTEVGTEDPTFRDPTCADPTVGYTLPTTTGVTYTIDDEDPQPGDTVTVTATADDGYVLADDAETSWEHTFGLVPDDCEVEPTVVEPAVAFTNPTCDTPDDAAVDVTEVEGVSYTVTGDVEPSGSVEVTATADEGYTFAEDAQTVWTHEFDELADCDDTVVVDDDEVVRPSTPDEPDEVEVLPNVVEKPAPTPAPTPAPAVAAQELPATGLSSTQMLLLALLLVGLGAVMILGPEGRREY